MNGTHPRPDLADYNAAARMSQSELVAALRDLLGAKLVAYLGKVQETRAVRQWADGTRTVDNDDDVERLRFAYRTARLTTERDDPALAQVWFRGLNPVLDDRPPALLLREGELGEAGPQVLDAARQFAASGRPRRSAAPATSSPHAIVLWGAYPARPLSRAVTAADSAGRVGIDGAGKGAPAGLSTRSCAGAIGAARVEPNACNDAV